MSCDKTTPFEVKEGFYETIYEASNDVRMGVGVSAIKYKRENENESFINDNAQVTTCGVNEWVRGRLGVTDVAGGKRERTV